MSMHHVTKTIIKSKKLGLEDKLKTISHITDEAIVKLQSCVAEFTRKVKDLSEINDESIFNSSYQSLIADIEKHNENLYFILAFETSCASSATDLPENVEDHNEHSDDHNEHSNDHNEYSDDHTSLCHSTSFVSVNSAFPEQPSPKNAVSNQNHTLSKPGTTLTGSNSSTKDIDQLSSVGSLSQSSNYLSISSTLNERGTNSFQTAYDNNETEVKRVISVEEICDELSVSAFPLVVPSVMSATITHVVSPGDFWMVPENLKGTELFYPSSLMIEKPSLTYIRQDAFCLAPFKNLPQYQRAKVLRKVSDENIKVFFIDHGSTQITSLPLLKPLPREAYNIPMQAFNCCLFGVSPFDDSWSTECTKKFQEYHGNVFETHLKFVQDNKLAVQLITKIDGVEEFSCDIADTLYFDGYCAKNKDLQPSTEGVNSNTAGCDSGVSVTSNLRSNIQPFPYSSEHSIHYNSYSPVGPTAEFSPLRKSDYASDLMKFESTEEVVDAMHSLPAVTNERQRKLFSKISEPKSVERQEALMNLNDTGLAQKVDTLDESQLSVVIRSVSTVPKPCDKRPDCNCWLHLLVPPPVPSFLDGNLLLVLMSHIKNPNEFYVNPATENSYVMDELQEQMTSAYRCLNHLRTYYIPFGDLKVGMHCAGYYENDDNWYRAKILRIKSGPGSSYSAYVQYIDYGNTALVKDKDLRPLTPEYANHPAFALKCTLAFVTPKNPYSEGQMDAWSRVATEMFRNNTCFDRILTAHVVNKAAKKCHFEENTLEVLLWDTSDDSSEVLINSALAKCEVACFDEDAYSKFQEKSNKESKELDVLDKWDPMGEEYTSIQNSYGVNVDDIQIALSGYKPKDEQYICKYFSFHGHCPRKNCPFQHVEYLDGGVTRDRVESYCLDNCPTLPKVSTYVLLQVSALVNPEMFYVFLTFGSRSADEVDYLVRNGTPSSDLLVSESFEVKELFKTMNEYYGNIPNMENPNIALTRGDIVAAFRKEDQSWHRGRVVDITDIHGASKIFFVDFGNEEWVERRWIREILPEYLHTPFRAVECHLSGVEPLGFEKGRTWSPTATELFKELVTLQILLAHVTAKFGNVLHVTLQNTTENDHSSIGETLVREGFAQYCCVRAPKAKKECKYVPG